MFKKNIINNLLFGLVIALTIGFFISRAMVSIATIAFFLIAVYYQLKFKNNLINKEPSNTFILFTGFYILIIICSTFNGQLQCLTEPLISFAPLFILTFSFQVFDERLSKQGSKINVANWILIIGTLFLLLDMVFRQGFNTSKIIQLAQDSKNVSNVFGIHHNIVGFMAIYSILYIAEILEAKRKPILMILVIMLIALIHYLGLRFAIMAFYPLAIIYFLRLKIKLPIKMYALMAGLFIVIASFLTIPAFQARYQNTIADLRNIANHHNPNYHSLNQRLIANEIGFNIAKKNWLLGVGPCQIKEYVEQEYIKDSRLLIPENRKFIHNQFIYGWATFGFFYGFGWLILFGFLVYRGIKEQSILLEITLLFIMHQMVENTLEKQLMLMLLVYLVCLMPKGLEKFKVKN